MPLALSSLDLHPAAALQALARTPPPAVAEYEPQLGGAAVEVFARNEARVGDCRQLLQKHQAELAGAVTALAAYLAAHNDEREAGVNAYRKGAELLSRSLQPDTAVRAMDERSRAVLAVLPASLRPRTKRLFKRLREAIDDHHDAMVEQYYRMLALAASLEASQAEPAASLCSLEDVQAYFAALNA